MTDAIIVNVPPYEGEYEYDRSAPFSHVEWRWIKQISGYMPLTIEQGWNGGDPDLMLVLACIAMHRAGKIEKRDVRDVAEQIENAAVDGVAITIKLESEDEEEGEADPPAEPEQPDLPSDEPAPSGDASSEPSEPSPESGNPSSTGDPGSPTTSESAPLKLAQ